MLTFREWWALAARFVNCISGFIVLQYYEVKLGLRFKMNTWHAFPK
jgi:hypothetical protein